MGIPTVRGYAIIIRHRFEQGWLSVSLVSSPVSVRPHLSTEIQGASAISPPACPFCQDAVPLANSDCSHGGCTGRVRRCSRLPWRPIVTGHPSPLISPTFHPHARWSGGRTTSSHTEPKTLVSYYAAKPVNSLLCESSSTIDSPIRPSVRPFARPDHFRATSEFFCIARTYEQDVTPRSRGNNSGITRVWIFGHAGRLLFASYGYAAESLAAAFSIQFGLVHCKNNYIRSLRGNVIQLPRARIPKCTLITLGGNEK